jgi:predicted RNase H-like HicB family nuclease
MEKELKLRMINEIKQLERELYLKKSRLSAIEVMEPDTEDADKLLNPEEWKQIFSRLIKRTGELSKGGDSEMTRYFTLEYWIDDDWYVGRLKEVPGVFSQGETLQELEENVRDAYLLMIEDNDEEIQSHSGVQTKMLEVAL